MDTKPKEGLSEDGIAALEMHAQQAKIRGLPADGWSKLSPALGGASWKKGDDYLDGSGSPVVPVLDEPEAPKASDPVKAAALELVGAMNQQELATFVMGDKLDKETLEYGMQDASKDEQNKFVGQFSDKQVKDYLKSVDLEIDAKVKRPALNQMLVEVITGSEPVEPKD